MLYKITRFLYYNITLYYNIMLGGYTYRNMFSKSKSFTANKIGSKTGSKTGSKSKRTKRSKRSKRPKNTRRTKKIGLLNF